MEFTIFFLWMIDLMNICFNLQHMLHKTRRAKTPSCSCGTDKVGTQCMWMLGIEKDKNADFGLCQDGSGANTMERLIGIITLGKGLDFWIAPYKFKWEGRGNVPVGLGPRVPIRTHFTKKYIKYLITVIMGNILSNYAFFQGVQITDDDFIFRNRRGWKCSSRGWTLCCGCRRSHWRFLGRLGTRSARNCTRDFVGWCTASAGRSHVMYSTFWSCARRSRPFRLLGNQKYKFLSKFWCVDLAGVQKFAVICHSAAEKKW